MTTLSIPADAPTLAEAYARIPSGGTITLAPGKYVLEETLIIDKPLTLESAGGNVTITSEKADVTIHMTADTHLRGIKIENTKPNPESDEDDDEGDDITRYALSITSGAARITDCEIVSATAGIRITGTSANPEICNCRVHHCGEEGIFVGDGARASIVGCEIYENEDSGIWVQGDGTSPRVSGCRIHHAKGGGFFIFDGAGGEYRDCEIYENEGTGFLVLDAGSDPHVAGCRIYRRKGGGIGCGEGAGGDFRNCDIYENEEAQVSAIGAGSSPTVVGCNIHHGKSLGVLVSDAAGGEFRENRLYENRAGNWSVPGFFASLFARTKVVRVDNEPNK